MDDLELLERYRHGGEERAFAELVGRHGTWIYLSARRQLGDDYLAEDAAQGVFLLLASKAGRLSPKSNLGAWLWGTLRYCISEARRQRSRQRHYEKEAAQMRPERLPEAGWEEISPLLDDVVGRLGKKDREVVLLRFYQQKAMAEVGRVLGISEKAAQKRVERAVEKLRERLAGRGVEVEAGSLGAMVLGHAAGGGMEGGVAGLAEKVMAGIGNGGAGSGTAGAIAKGAMKMMVCGKVKVVAVILIAVGVGAGAVALSQVGPGTARPAAEAKAAEVPTTVPSDMKAYSSLTKRDIQTAIEAKAKSTRNFAVTFQEIVVDAGPDEFALQHIACIVEGVKLYCLTETIKDADRPQETSRGEIAYDGQVSTTRPHEFRALVFRGREWWALIGSNAYYNLMMQHAGWEDDPGGGHPNSLLSIVRAETTKLRPDVEMVEEHPCRVLDAYEQGRLQWSVWLDCERGFLPVRQRLFMGPDQQLVVEQDIDQAIEIQDMWFATSGRRVTYPWKAKYPNEYAPTKVSVAKIVVDQYQPGDVAIRVNQQLPEGQFDLRGRLPLGTLVLETEATTRSSK